MGKAEEIARACGKFRRSGRGFVIPCPAPGHADRNPSCSVIDGDHGRPIFHCHTGCDFRDVLAEAERRGWVDPFQPEHRHGRRPCAHSTGRALAARRSRVRHEAHDRERRQTYARRVWSQAGDPANSPVETYLRSCGITAALPPAVRFGCVFEPETRAELPAMVAAVTRWPDAEPCGVHVTFLNSQGGKASVATVKRLYGCARGGAVCLATPGEGLAVGEGIESGLSYQQITGMPTWAALSTSGIALDSLCTDHKETEGRWRPSVLAGAWWRRLGGLPVHHAVARGRQPPVQRSDAATDPLGYLLNGKLPGFE